MTLTFSMLIVIIDQVQKRGPLSFRDSRTLLQKIDSLPAGPGFQCTQIKVTGDQEDEDGHSTEVLEMWIRDPVECVKELIGNPAFTNDIQYAPIRKWKQVRNAKNRVYDEAWTADWWWDTQV